jgi:hypothetical protein
MSKQEEFKTTTNRHVYNCLYKDELEAKHGLCPICPPHGGCNYWNGMNKPTRSWKSYRKTQWKE